MPIVPKPLTAEAILPFASVLQAAPQKMTVIDSVFEPSDVSGAFAFTIIRADPVAGEVAEIKFLERHPHSTQTFMPMKAGRWLVLVAPDAADGSPDLAGLRAFVAGQEQSICIARNAWHAPLTVLDRPSEFGMIMWKSTAGTDGVVHHLETPISVSLQGLPPVP